MRICGGSSPGAARGGGGGGGDSDGNGCRPPCAGRAVAYGWCRQQGCDMGLQPAGPGAPAPGGGVDYWWPGAQQRSRVSSGCGACTLACTRLPLRTPCLAALGAKNPCHGVARGWKVHPAHPPHPVFVAPCRNRHVHRSRCEDPMFKAPTSPSPSPACGTTPGPRAPPASPVSPVPPMRRPVASSATATARAAATAGRRPPPQLPQQPQQPQQRRLAQARPQPMPLVPPRGKYDRLALIEAGWDPAAAAAACPSRPSAVLSRTSSSSSGLSAQAAGVPVQRRSGGGARPAFGAGGAGAPAGPKKTDRVNRWRELEDQWSRDR